MALTFFNEGNGIFIGEVNQVKTKLTWVIESFEEKVICKYKKMLSPVFYTTVDNMQTKWQFTMTFDKKDKDEDENISIFIDCLNNNFDRIVQFSILDIDNEEINRYRIFDQIIETKPQGIKYFIKKHKLLNVKKPRLLSEGKLTIICTISTNQNIDVEKQKKEDQIKQQLRLDESEHLIKLFSSGDFSDVVFSVEGKEIRAHKNILANRSSVFRAMFTHEMEEAISNSVVVEDISYSTMNDLLLFIYSGSIKTYSEQVQYKNYQDLMIAANKYDINNLKVECERRLSKNLDIDNVFQSLALADTYNALLLKEKAIDFIASNADEIIESSAFKEFRNLRSELSCELFRRLAIKKRKIADD